MIWPTVRDFFGRFRAKAGACRRPHDARRQIYFGLHTGPSLIGVSTSWSRAALNQQPFVRLCQMPWWGRGEFSIGPTVTLALLAIQISTGLVGTRLFQ